MSLGCMMKIKASHAIEFFANTQIKNENVPRKRIVICYIRKIFFVQLKNCRPLWEQKTGKNCVEFVYLLIQLKMYYENIKKYA